MTTYKQGNRERYRDLVIYDEEEDKEKLRCNCQRVQCYTTKRRIKGKSGANLGRPEATQSSTYALIVLIT
jgi:hypothetical protein